MLYGPLFSVWFGTLSPNSYELSVRNGDSRSKLWTLSPGLIKRLCVAVWVVITQAHEICNF